MVRACRDSSSTSSSLMQKRERSSTGTSTVRTDLPAVALSTIPLATITRMTRSSVLEEISKDYVTTARAKGVPERRVIFRHVLKNALVPIVTITNKATLAM